jgi:hypothetical protein
VGKHRVPIPDLISAATAQISDLVVLHYDADFELISKVTGQAHEWVAERGTLWSHASVAQSVVARLGIARDTMYIGLGDLVRRDL